MIGQLVTIAFYVAVIFSGAAFIVWLLEVFNPYEQFEAEAHANDSDEDPPPIPGSVIPELARLNEDPDPTTAELRAALRQTQEREAAETWKAFGPEGAS